MVDLFCLVYLFGMVDLFGVINLFCLVDSLLYLLVLFQMRLITGLLTVAFGIALLSQGKFQVCI